MVRERYEFSDVGTRDHFFEQLQIYGYTVTKYKPGDICNGRIVAGDGTTVKYEVVSAQLILYGEGSRVDEAIVQLAKQSGANAF